MFPSPHGDKFQRGGWIIAEMMRCFRPLTGINFNIACLTLKRRFSLRFRPLTGINFNKETGEVEAGHRMFPSPHGDKFQRAQYRAIMRYIRKFPSPHGDKFQRENEDLPFASWVSVPSRG